MGPPPANTAPEGHGTAGVMTDTALEFAEEHGLGKVLGRVRLGSGIAVADGTRARATLLLSASGLWLVAARDRFHGQRIDLLTRADLRLVSGRVRDRLCFGQEELLIPTGRRGAVERLIALGRLAHSAAARGAHKPSRFLHEPDELGQAWLGRELAPGEVLIAWLRGSNPVALASHVVGESRCALYLLLTDRRAALVAWSAVGDVSYTALDAQSTSARNADDKTELKQGDQVFLSRRSDARACRDIFELLALPAGKSRLLEAARRTWLGRERDREESARTIALLDAAIEQGSQRARFARLLAGVEGIDDAEIDGSATLPALAPGRMSPTALGDLWTSFRFSGDAASALVSALLDSGEPGLPFAWALQRRARPEPSADETIARDELRLARFAAEERLAHAAVPDPRDLLQKEVLAAHGLARQAPLLHSPQRALRSELVEGSLSHPLARGQGSLVAGVQKLIALSPDPDHAALSDYCEALDGAAHPAAKRALDAARLAFSLPTLRAYVSRGKKSIGMRGYDEKSPYILLGQAHLDPQSPYAMDDAELHFAIGAEALHLKLGQVRLTSHDVWAGAFARTRGGVELALGLLPLLKGLPLAASVAKVVEKVPEPALRRGLEVLMRFEQNQRRSPAPSEPVSALSLVNENLVAAHRLMQMNADRAGAVLCGDLRASLRALLLVRPDTAALLDSAIQHDLVSVLLERDADAAMRADLVVRVVALLQFHASPEYEALRRALLGPSS